MVSLLKIPRSFYKLLILLSLKYGLLWPFTEVFWFLILIFSLWSHKIHFLVMFFHMVINIAAKFLVYSSLANVLKTLFYRNFQNFTLFDAQNFILLVQEIANVLFWLVSIDKGIKPALNQAVFHGIRVKYFLPLTFLFL